MRKRITLANYILIFILLIIMFYQIIFHFSTLPLSKILTTASILPIIMVPYLIDKIFHYRMTEEIELVYNLFILVTLALGSVLGLYHKIGWFDLLAHFLTGVVASFASCIILKRHHLLKKESRAFALLFMIIFSLAVSSLWEFFEFFSDKIFGGDTQCVKRTGVNDTMEDMLIAFIGSILFSGFYYIQMKKEKKYIEKLEKII